MPRLLLSPSQQLLGLVTQHHLFPDGERARSVMRPNNSCKRDHAYCRSSNRVKNQNYLSTVRCLKHIIPCNFTTKSKLKLSCISNRLNQRYIAISTKWRYISREKRIIFERRLLDWLLPIWTLSTVCEIPYKMQVVYKE